MKVDMLEDVLANGKSCGQKEVFFGEGVTALLKKHYIVAAFFCIFGVLPVD